MTMPFIYDDGGRSAAGYKGKAGDCGARAMAIALGLNYKDAYKELATHNESKGGIRSARKGINLVVYAEVLKRYGWVWHAAPKFDVRKARCTDLPVGPVIARQSHHLVAVVGGVAHDTWDCTAKMVYGYWAKASSFSSNAEFHR